MKRLAALTLLAFVGSLAAVLLPMIVDKKPEPPRSPHPEKVPDNQEKQEPLLIAAFINVSSGCMNQLVDLLKKQETLYPGKVKVEITDFGTPEGQQKMEERGLHCLTILIDGSDRFTIENEGGSEREVYFNKPPEFGNWKMEDLEAVIAGMVK